jgi:exonuclease SbcD
LKLIHLSDLHLGIRVNEFSMTEDQKYILGRIAEITEEEKPDAVIIAGDIYDKTVPPAEAVQLFDDFLYRLSLSVPRVFVISGNHDSPERIAFGSRLIDKSGIYLSPVYDGKVTPVSLKDEYGTVNFFMLPFVRPSSVRRFFPDENTETYTEAVRTAVSHMDIPAGDRNILITHQFVTGSVRSDSEDISVGGTDNVDATVFEAFDYTALGHIHGPQNVGKETVRYCGTPLKYSFSEAGQEKSVTVAELKEKGNISIRTVPLLPLHDMREIRGTYMELMQKKTYENTRTDDYLRVILTDEEDVPDAVMKLRTVYPNIMRLDYDNTRTRTVDVSEGTAYTEKRTPLELFREFYEKQNGKPMSDIQTGYVTDLIRKLWEEQE